MQTHLLVTIIILFYKTVDYVFKYINNFKFIIYLIIIYLFLYLFIILLLLIFILLFLVIFMVDHFCPWQYEKRFPNHMDSLKYI